jgi:hypothetical protein
MYRVYRQIVDASTVFLKYFGKLSKNVRECKNPADGGLWWANGGLWWANGGLWWANGGLWWAHGGLWWARGGHEKTPVLPGFGGWAG